MCQYEIKQVLLNIFHIANRSPNYTFTNIISIKEYIVLNYLRNNYKHIKFTEIFNCNKPRKSKHIDFIATFRYPPFIGPKIFNYNKFLKSFYNVKDIASFLSYNCNCEFRNSSDSNLVTGAYEFLNTDFQYLLILGTKFRTSFFLKLTYLMTFTLV